MNEINKKLEIAKKLHFSGKINESQKIYLELAKTNKKNYEIFYLIGTTFLQLKKYDEAISNFNISLNLNPSFANTYNNKGIALSEKQNFSDAIFNYDKAIKLKKDYIDAYINKGVALNKLKNYKEAIKYFKLLLKINPSDPKIYNNLGNVYKNLKNYPEAIEVYNRAIKLNKNFFEAISNKSDVLHSQKKYTEALIELNKIYKEDPDFEGLLEKIISNKMFIFEWSELSKIKMSIKEKIIKDEIALDPLFIHYLFDEPKLHKLNSEKFISYEFKNVNRSNANKRKKVNKKIKIGYFSGDFHNHPVLHIMSNIFKNHDKSEFELYAFSHGPEKNNNIWRDSIKKHFKKFFIINEMTDDEVIKLTNEINIDIAVNLSGLTKHDRTGVFFKRVAPIQVNYLGYPGTIGLDSMDYIIGDKIIIPEDHKKYYTEKVEYLPKCYIPASNDVLLKTSKKKFLRAEFNLPENSIVFCAFHNPLKINPDLFDVWVNILKRVKDSILWIKTDNKHLESNIKIEAEKRGLKAEKIVITEGLEDINDHIERLKLADIFLDTYPYNSHSTTYDYIRAQLPMVVWKGNTFSSRVASSIYSLMSLDNLIANNAVEYENISVELATNKKKLLDIKNKLRNHSTKLNLFDNKEFTRDLEKIYKRILKN